MQEVIIILGVAFFWATVSCYRAWVGYQRVVLETEAQAERIRELLNVQVFMLRKEAQFMHLLHCPTCNGGTAEEDKDLEALAAEVESGTKH